MWTSSRPGFICLSFNFNCTSDLNNLKQFLFGIRDSKQQTIPFIVKKVGEEEKDSPKNSK